MAELFPAAALVIDGLHDASQLREARYADVWMERWHDGRVLAHRRLRPRHEPAAGAGANLALIDAHVLAQQTTAGGDWPVFARYSHHRSAHLRFYSQASRGLTPMFQSHATVAPWLKATSSLAGAVGFPSKSNPLRHLPAPRRLALWAPQAMKPPYRILGLQQIAIGGPTNKRCASCGSMCLACVGQHLCL